MLFIPILFEKTIIFCFVNKTRCKNHFDVYREIICGLSKIDKKV